MMGQHAQLLFDGGIAVDVVEGVLLEEGVLEERADLQDEALAVRQGVRSDELHHLLEPDFLLEQFHDLLALRGPGRRPRAPPTRA